ncbi:pyridoxamine 5'-phosphate oxidase family protein [Brevibacillus fulvus]|uniref:Nitroimidazol reductase NimA-like FMN-containing flavoprotein (Pyridoxamine 5'-phosphate oxidase superfamily) n=1 Tax=Brevibacillus fulvus TaxID=1125967 RepID=A0A938XXT8_9BACL|nr:pyridoxamine 5'-phosphate oxidase family protein [Brevibacillus fulvus]MBM7589841.1 nitroimidazol reductase NimA-like FMN-containing flavoprotein (pyridoxamine 5'-phosphate oxidase superfamily) [Brevibacillus fulvus]
MMPIRLTQRTCTDPQRIETFLQTARVGHLGLIDKNGPYVVPLNFVWWKESIYFHGADSGRKAAILARQPDVCFSVCEEYGTVADPVPAHTDTAYMSVIIFGTASLVTDVSEKRDALQQLLDKHVPGYFSSPLAASHVEKYRSSRNSPAVVYRIKPTELTAKENAADTASLFYPGRTAAADLNRS